MNLGILGSNPNKRTCVIKITKYGRKRKLF